MSAWTPVPKPSESSITSLSGGEPLGLLIAITQTAISTSIISGWTDVQKPNTSTWVPVTKPTSSVWTFVAKPTS